MTEDPPLLAVPSHVVGVRVAPVAIGTSRVQLGLALRPDLDGLFRHGVPRKKSAPAGGLAEQITLGIVIAHFDEIVNRGVDMLSYGYAKCIHKPNTIHSTHC